MPAPTPADEPGDDAERIADEPRPTPSPRRHARLPTSRRRSLPWSERSILVASLMMVTLSAPLWLDPVTVSGLLGVVPATPTSMATPLQPGRFTDATAAPTVHTSRLLASDSFARRLAGGWGSADVGGEYALDGRLADLSVQPGVGIIELSGGHEGELALPVLARDVSVEYAVTIDRPPASGELELGVVLRRTAGGGAFLPGVHVAADGSVSVGVSVGVAGIVEPLGGLFAVREVDAADGAVLRVRAEAVGSDPTTIRLRVWPASAPEPAYWHVSVIDWTGALQGRGAAGLGWRADRTTGSLTLRYDDLIVTTTDGGDR